MVRAGWYRQYPPWLQFGFAGRPDAGSPFVDPGQGSGGKVDTIGLDFFRGNPSGWRVDRVSLLREIGIQNPVAPLGDTDRHGRRA